MIDVHTPHESILSWRDILLHLAIVVVGILIAIGLEQTVEYFHQRHELRITREELRADVDENRRITTEDIQGVQALQAELNHDMALLLAHRATNEPLPAKLDFTSAFYATRDAAWNAAQQSGALHLMPHGELEYYNYLFDVSKAMMESAGVWSARIEIAKAIANRSPDGQLSSQDTSELITAISETQGNLAWTRDLIIYDQSALNDHSFDR